MLGLVTIDRILYPFNYKNTQKFAQNPNFWILLSIWSVIIYVHLLSMTYNNN